MILQFAMVFVAMGLAVPLMALGNDAPVPREDSAPAAEVPASPGAGGSGSSSAGSEEQPPAARSLADVVVIDYENRPSWVESEPVLDGDLPTMAVCSGPWNNEEVAREQLDVELKAATDRFVCHYLHHDGATRFSALDFDSDFIERHLLKNQFDEQITVSLGPMYQSHGLLEFDAVFRQELDGRWQSVVATSRLAKTGLAAAGVIGLLLIVLGYCKADNATRGFYTRRLQFGAAVAILALVAAGVLLAKWLPWI